LQAWRTDEEGIFKMSSNETSKRCVVIKITGRIDLDESSFVGMSADDVAKIEQDLFDNGKTGIEEALECCNEINVKFSGNLLPVRKG
jgi:hypothetical protein